MQVSFRGDGLVTGYPPGVVPPNWLSVETLSSNASSAQFRFSATETLPRGTYTTTFRFVTGREDGSNVRYVDLPVTYRVYRPFGVSLLEMPFTHIEGSSQTPPSQQFDIEGDNVQWSATDNAAWLQLSPASGTGPASVTVSVNPAGLAVGTYTGSIDIADATSGEHRQVDVTLDVTAAGLRLSTNSLELAVDAQTTGAQLAQSVTVSDDLDGADESRAVTWHIASISKPWLQVTPAEGSSSPPTQLQVQVDAASIDPLANGSHAAVVEFEYSTPQGGTKTAQLTFDLQMNLPFVTAVGPHVVAPAAGGDLILRGSAFTGADIQNVMIGDITVPVTAVVGNTEIRVAKPAMTAGSRSVRVPNQLGLNRSSATLVASYSAFAQAEIPSAGDKARVLFDGERDAIYAVDVSNQEIERYYYAAGQGWSAATPIVVPQLQDAALSPDGKKLVVVAAGYIYDIDLTQGNYAPVQRYFYGAGGGLYYLYRIAMGNDGKALVTTDINGSGYTASYLYDIAAGTLTGTGTSFYTGLAAAAGDGGLAYAASGSCCSSTVMRYNMTTNSFSGTGISGSWYGHLTTNQSGSRFILSNTLVYAAPSSLSGNLHNGCIGSALAPDGNHAYCYDSAASGVRKYDLQAPLQSGAIFTQTGTVATSSPGTYWDTSPGVVTPDGSFYIVGGKDKILVTPVY